MSIHEMALAAVSERPTNEPNSPAEAASRPSGIGSLVLVARVHGIHLTSEQLIREHGLIGDEPSPMEILACARASGLKPKLLKLNWVKLEHLKKALPAILLLKNGSSMVLQRVEVDHGTPRVILQDPNAPDDALLVLDRARLEAAWDGDLILIKRDYDIVDETKPFGFSFIMTLIFRERRLVRDIGIAALCVSILALAPIVFWRLMMDRVLNYHAANTLFVLCTVMVALVGFETAFASLRRYLILVLTTRVDVKLSTYLFDRILNLPVDFFERTSVGLVAHDMNEVWKIRNFLTGQMFGTVLDGMVVFIFLPVMFFYSPLMTAIVVAVCGLICGWIVLMLPTHRRATGQVIAAETARGTFLIQNLYGIRTVKSLALDSRQKRQWDVLVAKVAKARHNEALIGNLIQTVAMPLERLMVSGTFALGVYLAISTDDPVYIGAFFAFLMLSQRVADAADSGFATDPPVRRSARGGQHRRAVGQPDAGRGPFGSRRQEIAGGARRIRECPLQVQGIADARAQWRHVRNSCGDDARA